MSILSSMDMPTIDVDLGPEKIEDEKERGPLLYCDLCDTEVVHKLAQMFLPGLASACVDNTSGDLFKTPGSVTVDLRKEMIDYLTLRSESFVAESVILEGGPDGEVSDHPFDIISNFVDDYASSKRNLFSRVSGWLLSEKREDKIDDFVQEMEMNGFWTLDRRETIAENLLKNVDFENAFHCSMKFSSAEELDNHVHNCNFRPMICQNEGCNAKFCAGHLNKHDSTCPFKIIPCEQKCSASIMRREMDRHCITVCPMKLVNCPFYAVGCRSAVAQCMIEKHRSDDVDSHLWHLLKGIHKEAYGEDLNRRVEQIASSSSQLAKARDVRSLNIIVKDLEAKLGPLEVSSVKKNSAETIAKSEDSDTNTNGSEHSTQASDMVNSSDKAEVSDKVDGEHSPIENKGNEERTETSNMGNLSDKDEICLVNEDSAQTYNENIDAAASELKIKGNEERTQTYMENLSDEKISATNEDNAENSIKDRYIEDSNLEDKDNEQSIQNSKMETKCDAENNVKNKDIENKGNEERTVTSNMGNLSDKDEIGLVNEDSAQTYNENINAAVSELKIKGNEESTQTYMENLSDEKISATNEDNTENSIKERYIEDSNLEDKDNEQSTQNSKMETKSDAENNVKNKDIEDDERSVNLSDKAEREDILSI
ncbi:uncharacterized protein LOC133314670 [Gastrolobium bilobum]|uniref:uncharacterized protein LOC133314670 n=1 Tax=Gastrolobium bilobum TaxID=150636 RepID=UPI002AB18DAA|nr:uncharacterized protein LOC133314670 [Gastrolobium bilobum]